MGTYLGGNQIDRVGVFSTISNFDESATASLNYYNGYLYLAGSTTDSTGWNAKCGYAPQFGSKGFFAKMDTAGQKVWTSLYDAPIYDLAIVPKSGENKFNELYFVGKTTYNNLATAGAYKINKVSNSESLVGKMIDSYNCYSINLNLVIDNGVLKTNSGFNQYYWYHNGSFLTSAIDTQLVITDTTGVYWVQIEKCNCAVLSDSVQFSTNNINNKELSSIIHVFPNPENDDLNINFDKATKLPVSIQIYDNTGKSWLSFKDVFTIESKIILPIASLPNGLYLLVIFGESGNIIKRFVKTD